MARVVVSPLAEGDTQAILRHLVAEAGIRVAENYLSALDSLYDRLASFPAGGPRRPGLGAHIRIGVLEPYVVFYRYVPGSDLVGVVRVLHGRRDVTAKLLRGG